MWIFSTRGFYSAVRTPAGEIMVRARVREDLVNLVDLLDELGLGRPEVLTTPKADYRFRILLKPESWTRAAAALAAEVDYPNFKSQVHGDPARDQAYMAIWSAMYRLQESHER